MLKAIKNRNNLKPKNGFRGWTYPEPEYTFNDEYQTITDLVIHVREYEKVNKLSPIENLPDILEDYFCRTCSFFGQFCEDVHMDIPVMDKVRRVISGGKAFVKIAVKDVLDEPLEKLTDGEIQENIDRCNGCSLNRGVFKTIGHEGLLKKHIEKAYETDLVTIGKRFEGHSDIGKCIGCGCKVTSKVFLHEADYGTALTENPHDINRLLSAKTGNGKPCWQLERVFRPEHLEAALERGAVTYKNLKEWGYQDNE